MLRTTFARRSAAATAAATAPLTTSSSAASPAAEKKTALYDFHVSIGGKMVPFAGWSMPVQYTPGVFKEHVACRTKASAFDVSHMGQLRFYGADREAFLEYISVADVKALPAGKGRLSCMLNTKAGILDDIIVTRFEQHIGVVINAGRTTEDLAHMRQCLKDFRGDVELVHDETLSLVALQGPSAAAVLTRLGVEGLEKLNFMCARPATIAGINTNITRCGYTGEDGFEISAPHAEIVKLSQILAKDTDVTFTGLGARDSLRMEAGMCLYGHELTESTNPVEACLNWLITKRRLTDGGFIGYDALKALKANPANTPMRRVGLKSKGPCAREEVAVFDAEGKTAIGKVTSGCPSPTLMCNIAQAYVPVEASKPGTKVKLQVRGKLVDAEVAKMSFVPTGYYTAPGSA
jgi:aminomethyltransferase